MIRVERLDDGTYGVTGLTGDDLVTLGGLAEFPLWSAQPAPVAETCAALHNAISGHGVPEGPAFLSAEAVGMVGATTV